MIRGFAAAQRDWDAREAPSCDDGPPEYGCSGDGVAICPECRGRRKVARFIGGRRVLIGCGECEQSGKVECGGCDWCAPVMGKESAA